MKLISVEDDPKTVKGNKKHILTGILYLAPSDESGRANVCLYATPGCIISCLFTAGRGAFDSVRNARIAKTIRLLDDRPGFLADVVSDIFSLVKQAARRDMTPAVRLNGTSDLPWERMPLTHNGQRYASIMALFPDVQFYDYTKWPLNKRNNLPANYHLTYSLGEGEDRMAEARRNLAGGRNVAVVFGTAHKPDQTYLDHDVVNGDEDDARFLDTTPVVVGLKAKGKARKDASGFVKN
jgi:hypothetical protein